MDQSSTTHNRKSRRSNVLLTATLETGDGVSQVKLRNLSAEGALVEGQPLPAAGSAVTFHRNDLSVHGRIAWVNGKQAGVSFDQQLQPDQVLRHVPPARQLIQPKFRRPGVIRHEMTPEEQRLVESWVWSRGSAKPAE